jgi:hypothetical protein
MSPKETEIHEKIYMNLTNLLDRIDLAIYHIQQSSEDYNDHLSDLRTSKRSIKAMLNKDFDQLARHKKLIPN